MISDPTDKRLEKIELENTDALMQFARERDISPWTMIAVAGFLLGEYIATHSNDVGADLEFGHDLLSRYAQEGQNI